MDDPRIYREPARCSAAIVGAKDIDQCCFVSGHEGMHYCRYPDAPDLWWGGPLEMEAEVKRRTSVQRSPYTFGGSIQTATTSHCGAASGPDVLAEINE